MDSRTATPQDARAVCSLLRQLGYRSGEVAVRRRLAELGDDDLVLLCEGGKDLVALHRVPLIAEGGSFARITALVIDEKHRGRGLGQRLVREAERVARALFAYRLLRHSTPVDALLEGSRSGGGRRSLSGIVNCFN